MTDEVIIGMSLRNEVEADLPDTLVTQLRDQIKASRDPSLFRDRLVHILTRYETYFIGTERTTKKDRRKQLAKLRDKSVDFLAALTAVHSEVGQSLEDTLYSSSLDAWAQDDEFDLSKPLPENPKGLEQVRAATEQIINACRMELDILDLTKGEKRKSGHLALDQLLIDLGALYENETGHSAKSQCYHDVTCEDEYSGFFFAMAKTLLDGYAPRAYSTAQGLGKRIERVLSEK